MKRIFLLCSVFLLLVAGCKKLNTPTVKSSISEKETFHGVVKTVVDLDVATSTVIAFIELDGGKGDNVVVTAPRSLNLSVGDRVRLVVLKWNNFDDLVQTVTTVEVGDVPQKLELPGENHE